MPPLGKSLYHFRETEVSLLFKQARRVFRYPIFDLLCLPKKLTHGRLLVVISRKLAKAHDRNKLRRQIKAIFYESNLFESNYDCMIIVKKEGLTLSFSELKKYVLTIPHKITRYFERHTEKKSAPVSIDAS